MTSLALTSKAALSAVVTSVQLVAAQLVQQIGPQDVDSGPHAVPLDLRLWLGGLRLLAGVPFGDLVADAELLPAESIRFFYVDRGWTDALAEGALSVGTVTTADRSALAALYGTVRAEVDEAERLVRLPGVDPGRRYRPGPPGRSAASFSGRGWCPAGPPCTCAATRWTTCPWRSRSPTATSTSPTARRSSGSGSCGWSGWPRPCCWCCSTGSRPWCTSRNRGPGSSSAWTPRATAARPGPW